MEWLNYHHLYYFWVIAQEKSISRAAARLMLTHPTLSAQLKRLESFLGEQLFDRAGRGLHITPFGAQMEDYASEIFRLGAELVDVARGRAQSRRVVFRVGATSSLPRTIVFRLLEPIMNSSPPVQLQVRQDDLETLLEMLVTHRVHAVLSDSPGDGFVRTEVVPLGETGVLLFGSPEIAKKYRRRFPSSLEKAPMLLPSRSSGLRRAMDRWFADMGIRPETVAEFDDAGLLRVFGALGSGLFPVRSVLKEEVEETHDVKLVGEMEGLREKYYAFTLERRGRHPLVDALLSAGRTRLLAPSGKVARGRRPPAGRGR